MKKLGILVVGISIGSLGILLVQANFEALRAIWTPENASANQPQPSVRLLFVGDIMPSRWVDMKMAEHGYDFPFEKTRGLLKGADVTFGNLESPVIAGRVVRGGEMRFRTDPEFLPALKNAGVDIVSLANNHIGDEGERGVIETMSHLRDADIRHVGAGTSSVAYDTQYLVVGSTTIAYIAQNDTTPIPASYCAGERRAGGACFDLWRLADAVRAARERAHFVVVSMHAGVEYTSAPNETQQRFARTAIDLGADIVIGHHPHWIQSRELYKGKWIYYSLGNFIFDQEWSRDTKLGLALGVEVAAASSSIIRLTHTIVRVDEYAQPRIATDEEAADMYNYLELP